ncbi:MAG: general secretion pathway protein GspK [Proteobacteria bacterium]|nr:general secretion pathway protein GspK [Actinomycetota bacterium]MBU4219939.1 general secretion pathway protein GspK [Actinomycetota bacterium]MBU4288025.1 general secretion pathway protein GspK [Pseudomonadota bacterium]MBU4393345.1 general secretion pathway protein GspK [Actinomycetota bacterium]
MIRRILSNNRGVAILVTIAVITILIAITLELNRKARYVIASTAAIRDQYTLSHMTSSGINAAIALLVKDKLESEIDSIQEDWADPDKIALLLSDIPFEDGEIKLKISDELSRIQVNALVVYPDGSDFNESQKNLWNRFLRLIFFERELPEKIDPSCIINSVKDWLDFDDSITGLNGAESEYYQDSDTPYSCRNAPLSDLNQLAMIKGVTHDIFYNYNELPGISKYMTVYGMTNSDSTYSGKININTAESHVIAALLPDDSQYLASAICEYRQERSDLKYLHDLSGNTWYKNVLGCEDIEIDSNLIASSSDFFRILSVARLREMEMTTTAIVQRIKDNESNKWKCKILSWQSE